MNRASNTNNIIVEPYLESLLAPKPYLKTSLPIGNNFFCGRDEEIVDIHDKLKNGTSFLMLHAHIAALFNIFGLSDDMKQVLRYSALLGPYAVDIDTYLDFINLSDEEIIAQDRLLKCGWLQITGNNEECYLTIHPLICDVLCNELKGDKSYVKIADYYQYSGDILNSCKDYSGAISESKIFLLFGIR